MLPRCDGVAAGVAVGVGVGVGVGGLGVGVGGLGVGVGVGAGGIPLNSNAPTSGTPKRLYLRWSRGGAAGPPRLIAGLPG